MSKFIFVILVAFALAAPVSASATSCESTYPAEIAQYYPLIFRGTVVSQTKQPLEKNRSIVTEPDIKISFKVIEVYNGKLEETVEILQQQDIFGGPSPLTTGDEYLIFSNEAHTVGICDASINLSEARRNPSYYPGYKEMYDAARRLVDKNIPPPVYKDAWDALEWRDYQAAFKLLLPMAEKGDAAAQASLGDLYMSGYGVQMDAGEGLRWLQKAADQKHPYAHWRIGTYYEGKQDITEAIKWYKTSADLGEINALGSLAEIYLGGRGVKKDIEEGLFWIELWSIRGGLGGVTHAPNSQFSSLSPDQQNTARKRAIEWLDSHGMKAPNIQRDPLGSQNP